MSKEDLSTDLLVNKLLESDNIDAFITQHKDNLKSLDFCHYLYLLAEHRSLKISEVLKRSQLSESYGYQLFNGHRLPSRDKVLQLIFGLGLDIIEANKLLKLAGKSELYVRDQRDAIILFALNKKWSLIDTETLLIERKHDCIVK